MAIETASFCVKRGKASGSAWRLLPVVVAGLWLYLPHLGLDELDDEEGRRAIPAREMLASGNFAVPTIWGEPYLHKPPLLFWSIAWVSALRGQVDGWSARLPSAAATLATALLLWAWGSRLSRRAGLVAALLFLVTFAVFKKGGLGELEPLLALFTLAGLESLWRGRRGSWSWLTLAGLFLGLGLLTKGPAMPIFFAIACIQLWLQRQKGIAWARLWWPWFLGIGVFGLWLAAVFQEINPAHWWDIVTREMDRGGEHDDWQRYVADRGKFLLGIFVSLLPGSALFLALIGTPAWRKFFQDDHARFLVMVLGGSFVLLLFLPGVRPRYFYPLIPVFCLAMGSLCRYLSGQERKRWLLPGYLFLIVGGVVFLAGVTLPLFPVRGIARLSGLGYALLSLQGLATLWLGMQLAHKRIWRSLWAGFVMLAAIRTVQLVEILPLLAHDKGHVAMANAYEAHLPEDEPIYIYLNQQYNIFFYIQRDFRYAAQPHLLEPGSLLIAREEHFRQWREIGSVVGQILHRVPLAKGTVVVLARLE